MLFSQVLAVTATKWKTVDIFVKVN